MSLHRTALVMTLSLLGMFAKSAAMAQSAAPISTSVTRFTPGAVMPMTEADKQNLVSNSDVILSATITAVQDVTPSETGGGAEGWPLGKTHIWKGVTVKQLTLQPKQTLLGKVPDGPLTVQVLINSNGNNIPPPRVGDVDLFFLQCTQDGFLANTQGVQDIKAVDDITKLVDNLPLTVTVATPATPFYFGQATPVTISLTNHTAAQLKVTNISLFGFYDAKRMESWVINMISTAPKIEQGQPMLALFTLDAHGKQTLTTYVTTTAAPSLALLGPDSFVLTSASLHIEVRFTQNAAEGQPMQNLVARSNWIDPLVGYPHIAAVDAAPVTKNDVHGITNPSTLKVGDTTGKTMLQTNTKLQTPVLTGPADGATVVCTVVSKTNPDQSLLGKVTFNWNLVPGAKYYELQVSTSTTFAMLANSAGGYWPNTDPATPLMDGPNKSWWLQPNQTYYWRVKAFPDVMINSPVPKSDWSPVQTFTVKIPAAN